MTTLMNNPYLPLMSPFTLSIYVPNYSISSSNLSLLATNFPIHLAFLNVISRRNSFIIFTIECVFFIINGGNSFIIFTMECALLIINVLFILLSKLCTYFQNSVCPIKMFFFMHDAQLPHYLWPKPLICAL